MKEELSAIPGANTALNIEYLDDRDPAFAEMLMLGSPTLNSGYKAVIKAPMRYIESGKLCHALYEHLKESEKISFVKGRVIGFGVDQFDRITDVEVALSSGEVQRFRGDDFVLAAGVSTKQLGATIGLKVPLLGVKGYTLNAVAKDAIDQRLSFGWKDKYSMVCPRGTHRIRVAGFVDMTGSFNKELDPARLAVLREIGEEFCKTGGGSKGCI